MKLSEVSLLSLQSSLMRNDTTTQAICAALEQHFRQLAEDAKLPLIYGRVDELDAPVLDELAWSLDIGWYDAAADVGAKRQVIKKALKAYRALGTPGAVEDVLRAYFGEDARVVEWFEYGGEPYMFKVTTSNPAVTNEHVERFLMALNHVKNARSWLEVVEITLHESMNLVVAAIVQTGDNLTLRQVV